MPIKSATNIIKNKCTKDSTAFDIGYAAGYFLMNLENSGYKAIGLDVAEPVVKLLQREGFQVWLELLLACPGLGFTHPRHEPAGECNQLPFFHGLGYIRTTLCYPRDNLQLSRLSEGPLHHHHSLRPELLR